MRSIRLNPLLACGAAAAAILPSSAHAQQAARTPGEKADEIIVTAQRRSQRLEEVPASVLAIDSAAIARSGVTNIHELTQLTPGVKIEFNGSFTQPSVRGVTTLTNGLGYENNVAIYVDGFYSPDTLSINTDLANVASVEVLKGPQGTLYGRNATGGALLINTLTPSSTFTANGELGYARYDDKTARAYVSGPLAKGLTFSLAGYIRRGDGYYRFVDPAGTGRRFGNAAPIRQDTLRAKAQAKLGERATLTLGLNYGRSFDPRGAIFTNIDYSPRRLPQPPFAARGAFVASTNFPTVVQAKVYEGTAKLAYETGFGSITSYTGYARRTLRNDFDFDSTYARILDITQRATQRTFQQTIDANVSSIDRLNVIVGGTYYHDRTRIAPNRTFSGGNLVTISAVDMTAESFAGYVDATYQITPKLSIGAGGRYTREDKSTAFAVQNAAGATTLSGGADTSFSAVTPRAVVRYELADRTNLYATVSRGFRSGGFQPTSSPASTTPFRPEKITAYEVGLKTVQGRARFEMAGFYYDYTDLQVGITRQNPVTGGLLTFVSNAPKAVIYGFEASAEVRPLDGLTLGAGVALLHGRYRDFTGAAALGLNAATNLNVDQVQSWNGLRMARAPDLSGSVNAAYETALAGGTFGVATNVSYTSRFPQSNPSLFGPLAGALANRQRYTIAPFALWNGQISWSAPRDRYKITAFLTNITDTKYFLNYGGTSLFGDVGVYNQPRTWGVKLGFSY